MKILGYTSILCLALIGMESCTYAAPKNRSAVYMTSQIQRLLNEKEEKMSKLEECDGKRKGFMIAGISTIGLTAVGVGVNIAQASKSNKLSNQIEDQNRQLEKQQANLANINSQISEIQSDNRRRDCESDPNKIYVNGQCIDRARYECDRDSNREWRDGKCVNKDTGQPQNNHDYSGYVLDCTNNVFDFYPGDDYTEVFNRLNNQCTADTGKPMEMIAQDRQLGGANKYECKEYPSSSKCTTPAVEYGVIGTTCNDVGAVWTQGGDDKCLQKAGDTETVPCSCVPSDNAELDDPNLGNHQGSDNHHNPGGQDSGDQDLGNQDPNNETPTPDLPDRIIGKPCQSGDVPAHATKTVYVADGKLKCLDAEGSTNIVNCKCDITECDTVNGFVLKDGVCQEDPLANNCITSGGEWKWLPSSKKYECHCGTLGNTGKTNKERGMMLTNENRCICLNGYRYKDAHNHKKGCIPGSDQKKIDEVIQMYTKTYGDLVESTLHLTRTWCRVSYISVNDLNELEQLAQTAQTDLKNAEDALTKITALWEEFKTKYNALNDEEKAKAKDTYDSFAKAMNGKQDWKNVDTGRKCVEAIVQKRDMKKTSNGKQLCEGAPSHGTWDNATKQCKCSSAKHQEPSENGGCQCDSNFVGNNSGQQRVWDNRCNMCIPPNWWSTSISGNCPRN